MRRKFHAAVKPEGQEFFVVVGEGRTEVDLAQPGLAAMIAPDLRGSRRIRQVLHPVHDENRLAVHADVTRIGKGRGEFLDECQIVLRAILLRNQYLVISRIPAAGPVFIGPAETEGHVASRIGEHVVNWLVEEALARKPVVVITKAVDAVGFRKLDLFVTNLAQPKVVKTQFGRQVGLVVPVKKRLRLGDIRPLGEAFAPPLIILCNGMELGKVKSNEPDLLRLRFPIAAHARTISLLSKVVASLISSPPASIGTARRTIW